jgi:hypothetical protein
MDYFLNHLIFVIVKCCVIFEVWTEFLNIIYMSFGFKELPAISQMTDLSLDCAGFRPRINWALFRLPDSN